MLGQGTILESVGPKIIISVFGLAGWPRNSCRKDPTFQFPCTLLLSLSEKQSDFILRLSTSKALLRQETFLEARGTKVNISVSGWLADLEHIIRKNTTFDPDFTPFFSV